VRSVRFRNVPAYVWAEAIQLETSAGRIETDVSFGGAFYVSVDAGALGLAVEPASLPRLIGLGREIKRLLEDAHEIVHAPEPELRDVYGVIFFQDEEGPAPLVQRNVTVFADGEVDRSPCGSGTSARLALLDRRGRLTRGETLLHRSVVGSQFTARVVGRSAVVTEVEGSAHLTGHHEFVLEPDDPLGTGFLLR
jgi:proline racemase